MESNELAKLIGALLNNDDVNPGDNFFELGGTSILALQLVTQIEQRWNVQLGLIDVIENPTPEKLALRGNRLMAEDAADLSLSRPAPLGKAEAGTPGPGVK